MKKIFKYLFCYKPVLVLIVISCLFTVSLSCSPSSTSTISPTIPTTPRFIQVTPDTPLMVMPGQLEGVYSLATGASQQFTAIETYSDGSTADVTAQVKWISTNTDMATISSGGLATGILAGTTGISATLSGNSSPLVTLMIVDPVLRIKSISITASSNSVAAGSTLQLSATGKFTDGSLSDVTSWVTWYSSNTDIATISSTGLITGKAAGNTCIVAFVPALEINSLPVCITVTSK